ncbi:MAG: DNA-3-methyladenine glycosylase [Saprospiraceae bacterium]|nr:DNA-3-methyladenine glycosylase [Saprospiraceae bacterium]
MDTTKQVLSDFFYASNDVVSIARQLLGKEIATNIGGIITSGIIVETEAYRGPDDRGCHAYNGRMTERTKTMYEKGGTAYVYVCYGMHPMMNVVTGDVGNAHAILIRAIQPTEGITNMAERRKIDTQKPVLTNGPGKLAVALGIHKDLNGTSLLSANNGITIFDTEAIISNDDIVSGPRVGMSIHVGNCSHRPWRFYIKNNPWVSKPLKVEYNW